MAWQNALTLLGTNSDKRLSAAYSVNQLSYSDCHDLWRGSDLAARIVESPVDAALRNGYTIAIQNAGDTASTLESALEDLGADKAFREALCNSRAFGGGYILLGADDGQTLSCLLEPGTPVSFLTVLSPRELRADTYYSDPTLSNFGDVETWVLGTGTEPISIHESRILAFRGPVISRQHLRDCQGAGDSVFVRVVDILRDFDSAYSSAFALALEAGYGTLKIAGLAELIGMEKDKELANMVKVLDMQRSTIRTQILDTTEDFERKGAPTGGLPELLDSFAHRLACAAGMPKSLLFGDSPSGLNGSFDSSIAWYYDSESDFQDRVIRPQLEKLISLVMATNGGEPDDWSLLFEPIWCLTDVEKANVHVTQANADQVYLANNVLTPDELRKSRFGDVYSTDTTLLQDSAPEAPSPVVVAPALPPNGNAPSGEPTADIRDRTQPQ
jgi:phage-related protein (TIGR01555 family)